MELTESTYVDTSEILETEVFCQLCEKQNIKDPLKGFNAKELLKYKPKYLLVRNMGSRFYASHAHDFECVKDCVKFSIL